MFDKERIQEKPPRMRSDRTTLLTAPTYLLAKGFNRKRSINMVRFIAFALSIVLLSSSMAFSEPDLHNSFRVKMLVQTGTNWETEEAILQFESDRMVLRSLKHEDSVQIIPYAELKSAAYTFAKTRRKSS